MTIQEQCKIILEKYPDSKTDTAEFMIKWIDEFLGAKYYITDKEFREFWRNEATLERTRRELLKSPQFKLPEADEKKRQDRAEKFRDKFRNGLDEKDQKDYDFMFNEENQ